MLDGYDIGRGIGSARDIGGGTALESANQFVVIRTAGVRELVDELYRRAERAAPALLRRAVIEAAAPIESAYAEHARRMTATGNLAASVMHKFKAYDRAAVAVVGPRQTGPVGSTDDARSGNHAWLVEFGSSRRAPGSNARRAYINVHQLINRRMRRSGSMNDQQFKSRGQGYYFLMGSINEASRQGGGRAGYSRDFMLGKDGRSGEQHPITLRPGETIEPMPAYHIMERTINQTQAQVLATLTSGIQRELMSR